MIVFLCIAYSGMILFFSFKLPPSLSHTSSFSLISFLLVSSDLYD